MAGTRCRRGNTSRFNPSTIHSEWSNREIDLHETCFCFCFSDANGLVNILYGHVARSVCLSLLLWENVCWYLEWEYKGTDFFLVMYFGSSAFWGRWRVASSLNTNEKLFSPLKSKKFLIVFAMSLEILQTSLKIVFISNFLDEMYFFL